MLKKNSIIKFAILAIIAVLGVLLCVLPFAVPYSTSNYNGLIGAINKGVELNGGVSAVYECKLPENSDKELSRAIDDSLSKVKEMFANEKYSELSVTRQGGNKISIVVSNAEETDYTFDYIEERKVMSFTLNKYSDDLTSPEVYMTSSVISKVRPGYDYESESYGVTLNFTQEGKKQIEELKEKAKESGNDTVYIYLGEINTENTFAEIAYEDLKGDSLFLTTSSTGSYSLTSTNVTEIAYTIASGSLDVELTLKETAVISAIFGKNTMLYLGICLIAIILGTMAFMWFRYGHLGLLGNLSLVFYLIIFVFLMQAIPFITFNLAAVIGSIVAFALAVFSNVCVFEKIREEYAIGKKIHLSCKGGFKKALWTILDSHVVVALGAIFLWAFVPASLKAFAIAIFAGAIVSVFSSLAMTRYFVNIYLPINSSKPKKLHLYRDKSIKEIKDEEVEIIPEDAVKMATGGDDHE